MTRWPHQIQAVADVGAAIQAGYKRICVTSPTGGGKTTIMADLISGWLAEGLKVSLYTNRKMLRRQISESLEEKGLKHGVRASGTYAKLWEKLQVSTMQTEDSRCFGDDPEWQLHEADRVLVDEAHLQTGPTARRILDRHVADGAVQVGLTATPIDLGGAYDHLIIAGTPSTLRACGALVLAHHYGPDEPDLRRLKEWQQAQREEMPQADGITEKASAKAIMTPGVLGRVLHWWRKLCDGKSTVLFGPGQKHALFFAEGFHRAGVSAAHVDSEIVWINGVTYRSTDKTRAEIRQLHKTGAVKLVTNRFVMREGIDWPWIECICLATICGSLKTYLQGVGRGLRACTGKHHLDILDFGGNWWRWGSVNADRHWELDQTSRELASVRADRLRNPQPGDQPQACRCPQCSAILLGWKCRQCGYEIPRGSARSRPVVELDGTLTEMKGEPFRPRRKMADREKAEKLWKQCFYRARSERWDATFFQAEALFCRESGGLYPPQGLPLMPLDRKDMARRVRDVPFEKLVPEEAFAT